MKTSNIPKNVLRIQWMVFKIRREKPVVEGDVLGTAKTRNRLKSNRSHELINVYITFNDRLSSGVGSSLRFSTPLQGRSFFPVF